MLRCTKFPKDHELQKTDNEIGLDELRRESWECLKALGHVFHINDIYRSIYDYYILIES